MKTDCKQNLLAAALRECGAGFQPAVSPTSSRQSVDITERQRVGNQQHSPDIRCRGATVVLLAFAVCFAPLRAHAGDPLPSWNEGQAKQSIVDFVAKVTKEGSPDFVPVSERIATFDNDGTLWCEQPMYVQLAFALDRVKALASQHPEWRHRKLYQAALKGDLKALAESGLPGILELGMATHAGMTTEEFERIVTDWLATARHPRFKRPYTDLVYQPMLEVLAFLRANGFKTFIVSGGGTDFMRPWTEKVYGIPPEQIIGSRIKTKLEERNGVPAIVRVPEIDFIDDKDGKAVAIQALIGRRPIAAFGNSDGDLQMLQWTAAGEGARFCLYVHHTDAEREWAYDRKSQFGKLNRGLDEAKAKGWTVVDMKQDWKEIYPPAAVAAGKAASTDVPLVARWAGDYPVAELKRLPENQRTSSVGFIGDAERFAAVWKAFQIGEPVPAVDFEKNLVVFVRNNEFYNRTSIGKVTLDDGVLSVLAMETRSAMPIEDKVAMAVAVVPRAGITVIQSGAIRVALNTP